MTRWEQRLMIAAVLAFFLPGFQQLLPGSIALNARWVALPFAALVALRRVHSSGGSLPFFFLAVVNLFGGYALLSAVWSQNSYLSAVKAIVFIAVANTFVIGGAALAQAGGRPLVVYAPIYLLAVGSSLAGFGPQAQSAFSGQLYQGYVTGPNMLGAMLAFSGPWIVERVRVARGRTLWKLALIAMAAAGAVLLLMSRSRASMLLTLIVVGAVLLLGHRRGGVIVPLYLLCSGIVISLLFATQFYGDLLDSPIYDEYVLKSGPNLLYTRESVFEESWENAKEGGIVGLGFGISNLLSSDWEGQATSVGFAREKGNSQLAIVEEIGWVGLGLYALVLLSLFAGLARSWPRFSLDPDSRLRQAALIGLIVGALVHSVFEAWFTAPGAPESAAFWMACGLALDGVPREVKIRAALSRVRIAAR